MSNQLCSFGCGKEVLFQSKTGRGRCAKSPNSCPENRKKNSQGLKTSGRDYLAEYQNKTPDAKERMAWAKGRTKNDHPSLMKQSQTSTGKRRITDQERLNKTIYWEQCQFNLAGCIESVLGYNDLVSLGMYHKTKNRDGVVRDHRVSIAYGYENSIDPKIISHPANCRFVPTKKNSSKSRRCEISVEQLLDDIEKFASMLELVD